MSTQRWFNVDEAATYLRCSPQTIRALIHRQEVKASKLDWGFRLDRADLDNFLLKRKQFFKPYRKGTRPHVREVKPWQHRKDRQGATRG